MFDHTLSLSALLLLSTTSPNEVLRVATLIGNPASASTQRRNQWVQRYLTPFVYAFIALLVWWLAPIDITWWPDASLWLVVAAAVGVGLIFAEILLGYGWLRAKGERPQGVELHRAFDDRPVPLAASTAVTGSAEEVIFRGVWIALLAERVGLPLWLAVVAAGVVYGVSHWFFGPVTAAQKVLSGIVYGVLFVVSGHAVLVAIAAHATQNIAVVLGPSLRRS